MVDDEWAAHFSEYRFDLGISLDGPKQLHDQSRLTYDGKSSFDQCIAGIKSLRRFNVKFGILAVVSEGMIRFGARQLMQFFEDHTIANYALLSLRKRWGSNSDAINYNRAFGKFMVEVANCWFEKDDTKLHIRELESKLDLFFGLPHRVCKDAGKCVGKYFSIESDGSVWHCDKFLDDPRFYCGNVFENTLGEIYGSEKIAELVKFETKVRRLCAGCKWFHLCGGGCPHDSIYLESIGGRFGTPDCVSFLIFEKLSRLLVSSPPLLRAALRENAPQSEFQ